MAFQPQSDFVAAGNQAPFTSQNPVSSSIAERKSSLAVSNGSFVSPQHEWQIEAKHTADGLDDLSIGPGASMDSHFKTEQGWSPSHQGFNHGNEYEPLMPDYAASANHSGMGLQYDHTHTGPPSAGGMTAMPNQGQFSMSPQTQPWMTPVGEPYEFGSLAPQGARPTPVFASSTSILRRDGIRKKNARFDIPAERTLQTIDSLIAQTADDGEIKELKQQKRLLRNRQAALDSRQRKKQHTERLEEEKKHYTNIITEMEEDHKTIEQEWLARRDEWMQREAQFQQWIRSLQSEKEQIIQHNSHELAELRRENAMLMHQLQKDSASLSASGSAGLSGDFNDFEQLTIQSGPWEGFPMQNDFSIESAPNSDSAMVAPGKNLHGVAKKDDKNSASGLLLMLLLCGAWVVSKGSTDTKEILPTQSDELRAASATVLEDLYKGSGVQMPEPDMPRNAASSMINPRASASFDNSAESYSMHSMANAQGLSRTEAFATPGTASNAQSMGHILRDAMRSVQVQGQTAPAAETYTKSLLADKVPGQVLKDFAQMVAQGRTLKHEASHQPSYD